ncbi:Rz1-like lysis system protein LysC [Asticcacaulis solisilvae]|uniref:Rz1-like lysis system protein LysC n=1 Tax=Asticcacaulis solisilvae TaxID=1217274 RepID=UPI003FD76769
MVLTACASRPTPTAPLFIPPIALQACKSDDPAGVKTVQDLANFSIEQERVLKECEAKRQALVDAITGGK